MGSAILSIGVVVGCMWLCTRGVSGFTNFIEHENEKAYGKKARHMWKDTDEEEWEEDEEEERPTRYHAKRVRRHL